MDQREQLRKAQLYIAEEIKRICGLYNIPYFLDCGTMLGAVRHHGFIPWDDDLDIGMLREDYERFIAAVPDALGSEFFLDNEITNPENALVFSKIRLRNTKYLEIKGNQKAVHNEIFVDVFPYYAISDAPGARKKEAFEMAVLAQLLRSKGGYKVPEFPETLL